MRGPGGKREEGGFALLLALAVLIVLGISVTAVVSYTSASLQSSDVSKTRSTAHDVAEAGLADAYAVLWQAANTADPSNPTLLGCDASGTNCTPIVFTVPGGTASVTGAYTTPNGTPTWTITSTGIVTYKGAAGSQQQRTLTAWTTMGTPNNQSNPNAAIWNYVMSTAPQGAGCEMDLTGTNVTVDVPIYVTGDLCFSGTNAQVLENTANGGQKVSVTVLGQIVYTGMNATIGTVTTPITSAAVGQGCKTGTGTLHTCSSATDKFFVGSTSTPVTITPPTADTSWWANADPGPKHPCQAGTVPALDNDAGTTTKFNNSLPTAVNLTPTTSYTCKSADGGVTGEISWNATTRVLTVKGTIFIDGNVIVTQSATYTGRATLYIGGDFKMNGVNQSLCATTGCNFNTWDPNTTMLLIASLADGDSNAIDLNGTNNSFQGGFFTQPTSTVNLNGTNINYQGPIVGGRFTWATNTTIKPLPPISKQPPGAPLQPNVHIQPGPLVYTSG